MHRVMLFDTTYENCKKAVDRTFELFPLDVRGKKVLIKPNGIRASNAEEGIVTHPAVVRAVVETIESLDPAEIVVGDNTGMVSYGANEQAFEQSGLMNASLGHYRNIGVDPREVELPGDLVDKVRISRAILEADVLISVPKFKTHGLTILTGGIKNSYGFLPGAQKANLHRIAGDALRFCQLLVDIFRLRVPDLFILDGVVGMEGNGPASPDLREIGCILASDNGLALDATMARMMGLEPRLLPHLEKAREAGIGEHDEDAIEILGVLRRIPNFKAPPILENATAVPERIREALLSRIVMRPKADPALCTGCGTCAQQCPVSALSMVDDLPIVDIEQCIACFCCQEMCPEKAISLR